MRSTTELAAHPRNRQSAREVLDAHLDRIGVGVLQDPGADVDEPCPDLSDAYEVFRTLRA